MVEIKLYYEKLQWSVLVNGYAVNCKGPHGFKGMRILAEDISAAFRIAGVPAQMIIDDFHFKNKRDYSKREQRKREKKQAKIQSNQPADGKDPSDRFNRGAEALSLQRERLKNLDYLSGLCSSLENLPRVTDFKIR